MTSRLASPVTLSTRLFARSPSSPATECPIGTQVGIATLAVNLGFTTLVAHRPVYNLIPDSGQISKIGFNAVAFNIQGDVSLRPGDYGLRTSFRNLYGGSAQLDSATFTIWGVPADPVHDPLRWNPASGEFGASSDAALAPYFTNPTSCTGEPLQADLSVDSWQRPAQTESAQMPFGALVGCDRLGIEPSLSAQPTTTAASSPSGLDVDLKIPRPTKTPTRLATSNLEDDCCQLARRDDAQPFGRRRSRCLHGNPVRRGNRRTGPRARVARRLQGRLGPDPDRPRSPRSDRLPVHRQAI